MKLENPDCISSRESVVTTSQTVVYYGCILYSHIWPPSRITASSEALLRHFVFPALILYPVNLEYGPGNTINLVPM